MVGGYTEDLAKLQNCPNFRVGACNEVRYFLPSDVWKSVAKTPNKPRTKGWRNRERKMEGWTSMRQ